MRIIGIDPGLNVTGIGIIEADGDTTAYLAHCVVRTKADLPSYERLVLIRDGVRAATLQWGATAGAIETSFVGTNARSAMALGQARAAAILALADAGLPVAEYSPASVKQAITGYGRGEKEQVARMVAFQLGLTEIPSPADATDALAVAITHWAHSRLSQRL